MEAFYFERYIIKSFRNLLNTPKRKLHLLIYFFPQGFQRPAIFCVVLSMLKIWKYSLLQYYFWTSKVFKIGDLETLAGICLRAHYWTGRINSQWYPSPWYPFQVVYFPWYPGNVVSRLIIECADLYSTLVLQATLNYKFDNYSFTIYGCIQESNNWSWTDVLEMFVGAVL